MVVTARDLENLICTCHVDTTVSSPTMGLLVFAVIVTPLCSLRGSPLCPRSTSLADAVKDRKRPNGSTQTPARPSTSASRASVWKIGTAGWGDLTASSYFCYIITNILGVLTTAAKITSVSIRPATSRLRSPTDSCWPWTRAAIEATWWVPTSASYLSVHTNKNVM